MSYTLPKYFRSLIGAIIMAIIIVFIYSDVKTQSELLSKYMKHLRMNTMVMFIIAQNVYLGIVYYYEKISHTYF